MRSVVLKEVLPEFARTHAGHPLASVFQPLVEENLPTLETQAAGLYRVLRGADLDDQIDGAPTIARRKNGCGWNAA